MRFSAIFVALTLFVGCALSTALALAQVPNPQAEREFQNYLNRHPQLRSNPELMTNPNFLKEHPGFSKWMQQHPAVAAQSHRMGAYDSRDRWHEPDWWQERDPDWVYKHHPEWAKDHPQWWNSYGANDDKHQWHDSDWWENHDRKWAEKHHPGWFKHHQYHDYDND
jgi:hypothetical protein